MNIKLKIILCLSFFVTSVSLETYATKNEDTALTSEDKNPTENDINKIEQLAPESSEEEITQDEGENPLLEKKEEVKISLE